MTDAAKQRADAQVVAIGALEHQSNQFEEALLNSDQVFHDAELTGYIQSVMDRLFPEYTGKIRVHVLDDVRASVFILPNGSVYINTGMLSALESEAQLAAVLAREGIHFIRRHGEKTSHIVQNEESAMDIPLLDQYPALNVISHYSLRLEKEADKKGFKRLKKAGYDVKEFPKAFQKLQLEAKALNVSSPILFFNHAKLSERIKYHSLLLKKIKGTPKLMGSTGEYGAMVMPIRTQVLKGKLESEQFDVLIEVLSNSDHREQYPDYALYYLGEAFRLRNQKGDDAKAQEVFLVAIKDMPEFAPNYRALGELYYKQSRFIKAKEYFEKYLEIDANAPDRSFIEYYIQRLQDASI